MDWLIAIGTGFVGKVVEYTVAPVGRQVGYLIHYNRNLKTLESQLGDLDAVRQSVERKVGEEKRNIREAEAHVNKWLTDVQKITGEANNILKEDNKAKMKCLNGFCPNLMLRHQLSRKSTKLVPDIAELYGKKDFNTFAHATTPQDVPAKDYEALGSRTLVVKQIMDVLRNNPNTNMIGVYGLGGVGKTTLVKEVSRQATEDKTLFDDVAMVLDVKKNPSIERIQKEIAEKLGLDLPGDGTTAERARRLFSRIKDQKTLVILDDVWERIDLEAVGLAGVATCKVLLTSRTREVLSCEMHTQKEFPLEVLKEEETWSLFEKIAGDVIKDPAIKTVATQVAKRCGGLPVLVVTVASALKNRSRLHAWKDALRRLKRFDKEEFTEKTYLALEWSYSQLNDEELKSLFLLCGLFVGKWKSVYILDLLKYSIGLGLLRNIATMGEAWDALNALLEKLKDSFLLLDRDDNQWVRMHDLVHDVAKRISSREQHVLKVAYGDELKEWPDNKELREKCSMISLRTSNVPKLPEVLQCKELKLFHLDTHVEDYSLEIPCNFFKETTKLRVLDLTSLSIPSLPPSLQFLKNLKTLCLDSCTLGDIALVGQLQNLEMLSFQESKFKELAKEIGQLTRLRLLDLSNCSQLEMISPNVISSLKGLEDLRMGNSFNRWDADRTKRNNASLSELKHLPQLSALQIHILDANILPTDLFSNALERYQIYIGDAWKWYGADATLNTLKLKLTTSNELDQSGVMMLLKRTDELYLDGTEARQKNIYQLDGECFQQLKHLHVQNAEFGHIINGKGVFPNLTRLVVSDIYGLSSLLSSSMARSLVQLTHLQISGCPTLEDIISTTVSDEENMENVFSKLQHLELKSLPNLTRICSRSYMEFPSLERQHLDNRREIEEMDSKENLENMVEHCLFDKKLRFPSLKRLLINGLTNLLTIWHSQFSLESFKNLELVDICSCESLKNVFPSLLIRRLQQLRKLNVVRCGVEVIVASEEGLQTTPKFVFSKVKSVRFEMLPQLGSFYPGNHASSWPSLENLDVFECNKVEIFAGEFSNFQGERKSATPPVKQTLFLSEKGIFPNLTRLVVSDIEDLRSLLSSSMARSLVQLTHLQISRCPNLEDIVSTKVSDDEENMENMFSKLQHLQLESLSNLTKFWSRSCMEFPSLERHHLDNRNEIEEMDSKENLEDTIEHCLFDKKLRFPSLKRLLINGLTKLMTIWHNQLSPESFKNLEFIDIRSCESLKNVFPPSLIRSLQQLMVLNVISCGVKVIVASEERLQTKPKFVFSKVIDVEFSILPQLGSFYPGMHASSWPSLRTLIVDACNEVEIFAEEFSNFQRECESTNHTPPIKQTLFLIEKDSFPNLEQLGILNMEIWDGPFPAKFFSKLKVLAIGNRLNVTSAPSDETSFHEGNSSGNIPAVGGILPDLRELYLVGMYKLMHLGEDNSQQPGQNFPNLEILNLKYCNSLKNLRSSAISFKNLTTLQVNDCSALEYLITYSTAKSLMQLTKLEVENCVTLTAIVGSNGADSGNDEIAFSRLKHLKLSHLPRMRGFCSGNCTVNFPLLETLSMSNRLKSKMFHQFHVAEALQITNERGDTNVDSDDDEMVTKENDEVDIVANGEHDNEIAQTTNENEDTNVAETCPDMPPVPVLSSPREVQKAHLFEWKTVRLMCVLVLLCVLMLAFGTYMRDLVV